MIRAALISILFLSVTLVLILMQPAAAPTARVASDPETVSRAVTGPSKDEALAEDVPSAEVAPEPAAVKVSAPDLPQGNDLAETSAAEPVQPVATAILAEQPQLDAPNTELEQLIVSALKQGQSGDYIDALVNDAASKNTVEVPEALITSDGRVDTASLLSVLQEPEEGSYAGGDRSYEVQPGDSLASIAYQFYGNTEQTATIFDANLAVLSFPDHVEVGQILVIPAP